MLKTPPSTTPFEAHHGREANTALKNLTKKPTLRNLNWENVIRSKPACLDERDPIAQAMPEPMDTNWGIRSDTEYDQINRLIPLKLAEDQAANQDDEPGIVRAPSDPVEITPAVVMQRTGERNMNRYRPLNSNINTQSEHTIEMSNSAVLRKSGVALKKAKVLKKKRAPGQIAAPPTPWDLKRKLLTSSSQPSSSKGTRGTFHSTVGKKSRFQNLEIVEDSESDAEDHLPLIATKRTLGTAGVSVKAPAPEDDEFRNYGNNPLRLLGTMDVLLETNGWVNYANIRVTGGSRPSIIGRDLMPNLGLQIVQKAPEENVMTV